MNHNDLYSYHVFLFPFKWNSESKFSKSLSENWKPSKPDDKDELYYNELKFFHSYVHPCLFEKDDKSLIKQYQDNSCKGWKYVIELKRRIPLKEKEILFEDQIIPPPDEYEYDNWKLKLTFEKVTLDLYEEQNIGIFAFHLNNEDHYKPEEILLINQFGRRIFPPFLDTHYEDFQKDLKIESFLGGTQHRELPEKITINDASGLPKVIEDFKSYNNKINYDYEFLPGHINYFFDKVKNKKAGSYSICGKEISLYEKIKLKPILDDRMFVICWYGSEQLTYEHKIKRQTPKQEKKEYRYVLSDLCDRMRGGLEVTGFYRNDQQHRSLALNHTHDSFGYAHNNFWYEYVFVDGYGSSCINEKMQEEQIEKHTYARWVGANTLYGITRYSFVCITEPKANLENPFPNAGFVIDHIQTIYFRMVSLVLAQRAMVLKFSDDVTNISGDLLSPAKKEKEGKDITKRIELLIKEYTIFINQIFHREITAQEQGIELYDMLQKHLRIEYQAKELEKEIDGIHKNADLIENRRSSISLNKITILGGIFLIPSLITAFTQAGWFDVLEKGGGSDYSYWLITDVFPRTYKNWLFYAFPHGKLIGALIFFVSSITLLHELYITPEKTSKSALFISLISLTVLFTIFYPVLNIVLGFLIYIGLIIISCVIFKVKFPNLFKK